MQSLFGYIFVNYIYHVEVDDDECARDNWDISDKSEQMECVFPII